MKVFYIVHYEAPTCLYVGPYLTREVAKEDNKNQLYGLGHILEWDSDRPLEVTRLKQAGQIK
jgi:hypothetical protein